MDNILNRILDRVYSNGIRFNGKIPFGHTDSYGKYILNSGGGWTDSFYVGMLYLCYGYSNDDKFLNVANMYQEFYRKRTKNTPEICKQENYIPLDHDTGFIYLHSQVLRYQLTGDEESKKMAIEAAYILADRFNDKGNFIRAWDTWSWDYDEKFIEEKKGKMIIDCMMNLPLLMWAYNQTGDIRLNNVAIRHADTAAKYIVREDYSTYHHFNFNYKTGGVIGGATSQGYDETSCYKRGVYMDSPKCIY